MMAGFISSFAALLAITNVVPILPAVRSFTSRLRPHDARRYERRALLGAYAAAGLFIFVGPALFWLLSLDVDDFRIAGGVILVTYATHDILFSRTMRNDRQLADVELTPNDLEPPITPLGIPIFVGPGTLSLLLVLPEVHGSAAVALALAANLVINLVCLAFAGRLLGFMGEGISRAIGKLMSLVLAAVGVGMLRAALR